jgi:antitoxin PrlF
MSANPIKDDNFTTEPNAVHHVFMGKDGRIVIPANIRSQVNMPKGGAFVIRVENGVVTLEPLTHAIAAVQAMMKRYAVEGVSIVDELIADRRAEAAKEDEEGR